MGKRHRSSGIPLESARVPAGLPSKVTGRFGTLINYTTNKIKGLPMAGPFSFGPWPTAGPRLAQANSEFSQVGAARPSHSGP